MRKVRIRIILLECGKTIMGFCSQLTPGISIMFRNCFVYWSLRHVRCHWHGTLIQLMEISLPFWEQFQSWVRREDESESSYPLGFLCPWLHDCWWLYIQCTRARSWEKTTRNDKGLFERIFRWDYKIYKFMFNRINLREQFLNISNGMSNLF